MGLKFSLHLVLGLDIYLTMKNLKINNIIQKRLVVFTGAILLLQACGVAELARGVEEAELYYTAEAAKEAMPLAEATAGYRSAAAIAEEADHGMIAARRQFGERSLQELGGWGEAFEAQFESSEAMNCAAIDRQISLEAALQNQRRTALQAMGEVGIGGVTAGGAIGYGIAEHRRHEKETRCRTLGDKLQNEQDTNTRTKLEERIIKECLN